MFFFARHFRKQRNANRNAFLLPYLLWVESVLILSEASRKLPDFRCGYPALLGFIFNSLSFFLSDIFLSTWRVELMSLRFHDSLLSYSRYQRQEKQKLPFDMYEEDEEQRFAYSLAVARAV